jgi:hypothetical protein
VDGVDGLGQVRAWRQEKQQQQQQQQQQQLAGQAAAQAHQCCGWPVAEVQLCTDEHDGFSLAQSMQEQLLQDSKSNDQLQCRLAQADAPCSSGLRSDSAAVQVNDVRPHPVRAELPHLSVTGRCVRRP